MRSFFLLALSFALLLFVHSAGAEYMDHTDSRLEYAQSVSALYQRQGKEGNQGSDTNRGTGSYTLVLFRTAGGVPDFEKLEPDILIAGPNGCFTAAYTEEERALAAVGHLHTVPGVIYAELDGEVLAVDAETGPAQEDSGEPYSFHSYGALEMGFGEAALWCKRAGEGSATAAVIDSGVYPHSFLSTRLTQSGFDYVERDEDATNDAFGHGTHVAGIIVDCTPDLPVFIRPIRVLNASGRGTVANTTSAVFEAAESGCDVINLSLVSSKHSEALEDAILFAVSSGSAVVVSAGNNGNQASGYCPVHMEAPGVIVVGACSGTMDAPVRTSYSNYGPGVDVYAFGSAIWSCSLSDGFRPMSGTSQAAPHISALCAVMKLLFPSIGGETIEKRIKALAGGGEVNVPHASLLAPETMGITAESVSLPVGTSIKLMENAVPELSFVSIHWSCEDEETAYVDESGFLHCNSPGTTVLHGDGPANADVEATLHVVDASLVFRLPESMRKVNGRALYGTSAKIALLPAGMTAIAPDALLNSQLETVFYDGADMLFEDLLDKEKLCFVIGNDQALWRAFQKAGIPYLIHAGDAGADMEEEAAQMPDPLR